MRSYILTRRRSASSPSTHRRPVLITATAVALLSASALLAPATSGGYLAKVTNTTNTAGTAQSFSTCASALAIDKSNALFSYQLTEPSGSTTATDYASGSYPGTYRGTMTSSPATPTACPRDTGGTYVLNGSTNYVSAPVSVINPTTFSLELWFKTTVAGGKLIGFGNQLTGASTNYDRHLYFSSTGNIIFGVYNGATNTIVSPLSYNDGLWHQAVATFSGTTGMTLYMDGKNVVANATYTTAQNFTGNWRIGYDNLNGWPSAGSNYFFTGSMRFAAVYTTVLTASQITNHFTAGQ